MRIASVHPTELIAPHGFRARVQATVYNSFCRMHGLPVHALPDDGGLLQVFGTLIILIGTLRHDYGRR